MSVRTAATTVGPYSLVQLNRMIVGQRTETETVKSSILLLGHRLETERNEMLKKIEAIQGNPEQVKAMKAEIDQRYGAIQTELDTLRGKVNEMIGPHASLRDIVTTLGTRPLWSYVAEAIIDAGRPLSVREMVQPVKNLGFPFKSSDPTGSIKQCLSQQNSEFFIKIEGETVTYDVKLDALPKTGGVVKSNRYATSQKPKAGVS